MSWFATLVTDEVSYGPAKDGEASEPDGVRTTLPEEFIGSGPGAMQHLGDRSDAENHNLVTRAAVLVLTGIGE